MIGNTGARGHDGRSVLDCGGCIPGQAGRPHRADLLGWECLFAKRLEDGVFRWPKIEDAVMHLSAAQLSALLEELDWRHVHEARETTRPTQH